MLWRENVANSDPSQKPLRFKHKKSIPLIPAASNTGTQLFNSLMVLLTLNLASLFPQSDQCQNPWNSRLQEEPIVCPAERIYTVLRQSSPVIQSGEGSVKVTVPFPSSATESFNALTDTEGHGLTTSEISQYLLLWLSRYHLRKRFLLDQFLFKFK
jgi:hypothetical protein